jgi:hypothetical protein
MQKENYRYTVEIHFKKSLVLLQKSTNPIIENVKTLKEASIYKEIIDESVTKAFIKDNSNDSIIESWV